MKKKIFHNITANFLIRGITFVFSFFTVSYGARTLQPAAYGSVSFAFSVTGIFVTLAAFGLPIYGMREISGAGDERRDLSRVFSELWGINVLMSLISAGVLLVSILLIPKLWGNAVLMLICGSAVFFRMLGCEWLYQGLEKFHLLAVFMLISRAASLLLMILLVHSEVHIILYAVFSVSAVYGCDLICFFMLRRYVDIPIRIRISPETIRRLSTFFLMSCAVTVYNGFDRTMLGFVKTEYETGLFSLAYKIKTVLLITGSLVCTSILPQAVRLWKKGDHAGFASLAQKSIAAVCGIQLIVMALCMIFAGKIILLTGGESYLESVTAFRILLLSLVPIGASNILGELVLIPTGRESRLLRAEVLGAVFNVLSNLVLIPRFSIIGAAAASVLTEIVVLLVCLHYAKKDPEIIFLRR